MTKANNNFLGILRKIFFILIEIIKSGKLEAYNVIYIKFLQVILMPFDLLFALSEKIFYKSSDRKDLPIIFIIGIQRTGSTVVSQFIADTFPFFPIGNFSTFFRKSSYIPYKIFSKFYKSGKNRNYKNFYGISTGHFSIGDAYEFWDQWFGKDHYSVPSSIDEDTCKSIRKHMNNIYRACNQPLVTKNNRNSLMIEFLHQIFPNAFFIVVERKPLSVIRSTVKASKVFFNKRGALWGLKPHKNFEANSYENISEAATVQYLELKKQIDNQLKNLPDSAYSKIDYEKFCSNPIHYQDVIFEKINKQIPMDRENIVFYDPGLNASKRLENKAIDNKIHFYLNKWENKYFV